MTMRRAASFVVVLCLVALATSQDSPQAPDRIPDDAMQNRLIRKVNPVYPPLARQARIQGIVILKIVISKSGNVQSLQLVKGHPMLAPAAFDAVRQWKYQAYILNGEAIEVETNVQVNFVLGPQPPSEGIAGDAPGGVHSGVIGNLTTETPQTSVDPAKPKPVQVSEAVMRGFRTVKIVPTYPPMALSQRIEGEVRLKMLINTSGDVEKLDLISGHPIFVAAVIEAVKQWKYKPYLLNGEPAEVDTLISVRFTRSREHDGEGSADDSPLPKIDPGDGVRPGVPHPPVPKRVSGSDGAHALCELSYELNLTRAE